MKGELNDWCKDNSQNNSPNGWIEGKFNYWSTQRKLAGPKGSGRGKLKCSGTQITGDIEGQGHHAY